MLFGRWTFSRAIDAVSAATTSTAVAARARTEGNHRDMPRPYVAVMVNQVESRPRSLRKVSPLGVTVPWLPTSFIVTTRPPHRPFPSRSVMLMLVRLPRLGNAFSTAAAVTLVVQDR